VFIWAIRPSSQEVGRNQSMHRATGRETQVPEITEYRHDIPARYREAAYAVDPGCEIGQPPTVSKNWHFCADLVSAGCETRFTVRPRWST